MPCVQCVTEKEAFSIGVFFNELFSLVAPWNDESKLRALANSFAVVQFNLYKYQHLILWIFKKLAIILMANLMSNDFMQIKNALLVLNELINVFPAIEEDSNSLIDKLEKVTKST